MLSAKNLSVDILLLVIMFYNSAVVVRLTRIFDVYIFIRFDEWIQWCKAKEEIQLA